MAFISEEHARAMAEKFRVSQDRSWNGNQKIHELEAQLKELRKTASQREALYKIAHEDFEKTFEPLLRGEAVIDGYSHRFPHCDSYVLHAPTTCRYCDAYPARQAKRQELGVAFTGVAPTAGQIPCPSELLRPASVINRWPGNRPAED